MVEKNKNIKPHESFEIVFDCAYLLFTLIAGLIFILSGDGQVATTVFGVMALVLGAGDAFHLLPRVYSLATGTFEKNFRILAFGKLITSITMTVFYVLLFEFFNLYFGGNFHIGDKLAIYGLAAIRIILCLLPQNKWFETEPSFKFAIFRNIPFAILGAILALMFASGFTAGNNAFALMPIAILLSFVYYFVVVLWAHKKPALGAFMLPKTCVYIWMICMGFAMI